MREDHLFNSKLAKLAKDEQIPLIDINSKLNDKGGLNKLYDGNDGGHLNGQGYLVWTNVLKPYL